MQVRYLLRRPRKNFDELPDWARILTSEVMKHGNLARAADKAGITARVKKIDLDERKGKGMIEALREGGLDSTRLTREILDCLETTYYIFDKNGNAKTGPNKEPIEDKRPKLKVIDLICRLKGDYIHEAAKKDETKRPENLLELFKEDDPPDGQETS